MPDTVKFSFAKLPAALEGITVLLAAEGADGVPALAPAVEALLAPAGDLFARAAQADRFDGKSGTSLELIAPTGLGASRLIVLGVGKPAELKTFDWLKLGGTAAGKLPGSAKEAGIVFALPGGEVAPEAAAEFALGVRLRAYSFDRYKTKKKPDDSASKLKVTLYIEDDAAAKRTFRKREGIGEGVVIARDLVNEPANVLTPTEFARRTGDLAKVDVEVEVLGEKELRKLGMGALLGVGQGSVQESRVVVMRWRGGKEDEAPVAFIGKGVVFDTGGISIKQAAGMEDMKGDMGGAACVVGLMHALASRKAKVNAVGLIGLVENMPDGNAQRPGDIVTSMSGQTIEIINTDAEGRLVLGDVLWYAKERFKPRFMIDLATLTGAIMVALGTEHAGLFSNDDTLAERLASAGQATGEKVWRMPLSPDYDKMIDSKFADMKNTGGRFGGSITAAQFLKRFVADVPWAHLDIAGTAINSPSTEFNRSWGAGWGVRLLDQLVADHYES
ncbi:leucyl aminopeptidase [Ancylobacter amanitiformis]|uniref:Probable cytosol aminopeptidase n=1 Tax=Ancylobacter amanitiformis TaxID=217069 RepID=A0ABU0LNB9_9HYPH|nr:leucyl aminopeptidase [Ancylobacter amanitiformis]MDQ0510164.1 leucyl aminopeptidase [Ancylobacter amanitiformis]